MALVEIVKGVKSFFKSGDAVTLEQQMPLRNLHKVVNLLQARDLSFENIRSLDPALEEELRVMFIYYLYQESKVKM